MHLQFHYLIMILQVNDVSYRLYIYPFSYIYVAYINTITTTTTTAMCIFDIIYHVLCNLGLFRCVYVSLTLFIL